MLSMERTQQITDIIHGTIQYSGIESAVISTPIFNRLHRVLQSSMVYLTYSSNKVKRFEHSVGTMHLAGKIFFNSVANNPKDDAINSEFINELEEEILRWYQDFKFISSDLLGSQIEAEYPPEEKTVLQAPVPDCALYRENTPSNIEEEHRFAYTVAFQAVRLAGLLHDVGHLPYSHVLEEAVRMMYFRVKAISENRRKPAEQEFYNIINVVAGDNMLEALHEKIGNKLVMQIEQGIINELPRKKPTTNIFLGAVFDFTKRILKSAPTDNNIFSDLHRIVAGTVDADRMDYCSRDMFCAGLRKDIYPYDRVISTYRLRRVKIEFDQEENARKRFLFCPAAKSLYDIEDLLERRYTIFDRINFHHRAHKHEVLFAEVLASIGLRELHNDSEGIPSIPAYSTLPLKVSSIWTLVKKLQDGRSLIDYLIIQLDDSWLDTLLKQSFLEQFKEKYRDPVKNGNLPEWNRFDELISATKHYISCFKRNADFRTFDIKFSQKWKSLANLDLFEEGSVERGILEHALELIIDNADPAQGVKEEFLFNYLLGTVPTIARMTVEDFLLSVEQKLDQETAALTELNVRDCLIRSCNFGLGYDTKKNPVYLWINDKTELKMEKLSVQSNNFLRARKLSVPCHLYCMPTYDEENLKTLRPNTEELIRLAAEIAAKEIWAAFENRKQSIR